MDNNGHVVVIQCVDEEEIGLRLNTMLEERRAKERENAETMRQLWGKQGVSDQRRSGSGSKNWEMNETDNQ